MVRLRIAKLHRSLSKLTVTLQILTALRFVDRVGLDREQEVASTESGAMSSSTGENQL